MDIQNISNHSPFIYKPTQEIHGKEVPITTLINNKSLRGFHLATQNLMELTGLA